MLTSDELAPLAVRYVDTTDASPQASGTLALLGFGTRLAEDPRALRVPLRPLGMPMFERWHVVANIACGDDGALHWAAGGGWMFVALDVHEVDHGGSIETASEYAYRTLCGFIASRPERHLLRAWNYLHAINDGAGDAERYRHFCVGRARGLAALGVEHYPAATAIGHRDASGLLQIYALCAMQSGQAFENPRQVSAWRYPRQYGPTPPSFARAMKLPRGGVAISGTAAVVGHASQHSSDVEAQVSETCLNLRALLEVTGSRDFDEASPLKVYLRHTKDAAAVETALAQHLDPRVPRILLPGDICRGELLVEIDGWSNLPGATA